MLLFLFLSLSLSLSLYLISLNLFHNLSLTHQSLATYLVPVVLFVVFSPAPACAATFSFRSKMIYITETPYALMPAYAIFLRFAFFANFSNCPALSCVADQPATLPFKTSGSSSALTSSNL